MWLPRSVDHDRGGFHQNWDRTWNHTQDKDRFIVFQSRMLWFASHVAMADPTRREAMLPVISHGVAMLRDRLLDKENGGYFWVVDLDGNPLGRSKSEKHCYGQAFALFGLSAAARATGDKAILDLAIDAFRWLDTHYWDPEFGGAFEAVNLAGDLLMAPLAPERPIDLIGVQYGQKAQNSQLHVLEALSELVHAWPDPVAVARLEEMVAVTAGKMFDPAQHLNVFFTPNWTKTSTTLSCGHDIEAGYLLIEALRSLGKDDATVQKRARILVDNSLGRAWDKVNGGLYDAIDREKGPNRATKIWWVQAETLNAAIEMDALYGGETSLYAEKAISTWEFISKSLIDPIYAGWYTSVSEDGKTIQHAEKGHMWKAAYHDGRALINGLRVLGEWA